MPLPAVDRTSRAAVAASLLGPGIAATADGECRRRFLRGSEAITVSCRRRYTLHRGTAVVIMSQMMGLAG